jgi:hypothetical protein
MENNISEITMKDYVDTRIRALAQQMAAHENLTQDDIDRRLIGLKELLLARYEAQEHNITLAKNDVDRRLEGMNEFREQLNRQASTFITKEAHDMVLREPLGKLNDLVLWKVEHDARQARSNVYSIIAVVIAVISAAVQIAIAIYR